MKDQNPNRNAPYQYTLLNGVLIVWGTSAEYKTVREDINRVIFELKQYLKEQFPTTIVVQDLKNSPFSQIYIDKETNDIRFSPELSYKSIEEVLEGFSEVPTQNQEV